MNKALARAVYARTDLVILDDVLASLDPVTKEHVFDDLLGPWGLFRRLGTTVIMTTSLGKARMDAIYVYADASLLTVCQSINCLTRIKSSS